jgi:alkanesulfonate monooxygenase SsuD/methylene tetrahydromethanopterin reductase-like flavin-dependent oxidoreductase (luciferase family)
LPFSGAPDGPCFETWTTLAAMATQTCRIRIDALVNGVIYRDPATLAKSATMVDIMSNGRLEFTLAAAWVEREFRTYGLPFPPLAERLARLDEALTVVRALWTQPRTTYEGRYHAVHDAPLEPKPLQQPHPPIMVGGSGRGTLQVAAKHADAWKGMGSPQYCAGRIALLRAYCAALGRDASTIELSVHPLQRGDRGSATHRPPYSQDCPSPRYLTWREVMVLRAGLPLMPCGALGAAS